MKSTHAPAEDIARQILGEDVTQIEVYTERVKRMVGRVLHGNGITELMQGRYRLIGSEELIDGERDALLQLCCLRLDAFRAQRDEEVYCDAEAFGYAHRSRHRSPISGSVNTGCSQEPGAAASAAGQAVAWQTPHQRALEVGPIITRNQGGSDAISNQQALCFRCNAGTLKGPGRRSALRSSSPVGRPRP